jgi:hypothetical protein
MRTASLHALWRSREATAVFGKDECEGKQMNPSKDATKQKLLGLAFKMPSVQNMMSRKTSVTNAFVCAIIPVLRPSFAEIEEALCILRMEASDVRCAYCRDKATEWDHLRPLVKKGRPTGFISEIANLVPSCGKCNQSKGNSDWREWMLRAGRNLSPTGRGLAGVAENVARLEAYERWRSPMKLDFSSILGSEEWEDYWSQHDGVIDELRRCQNIANLLREKIVNQLGGKHR